MNDQLKERKSECIFLASVNCVNFVFSIIFYVYGDVLKMFAPFFAVFGIYFLIKIKNVYKEEKNKVMANNLFEKKNVCDELLKS